VKTIQIPRVVGETTITGKNQITLPAAGLRELGWQRGDRLTVKALGDDTLVITRLPEDLVEHFAGKLGHIFGDHDEVMRYIEEERRSWEPEEDCVQP
jgi:AbrB family looped-hinge helix DNA binding protein